MAATGFLVNGFCAVDSVQAMNIFASQFPKIAGSAPSMLSFTSGSFTAPNTFNFTIAVHDLTGNQFQNILHSITLLSCDPAISITGATVFDPVVGASFWSFAMTFVFGVFLLARNAQAIISAVKRF